ARCGDGGVNGPTRARMWAGAGAGVQSLGGAAVVARLPARRRPGGCTWARCVAAMAAPQSVAWSGCLTLPPDSDVADAGHGAEAVARRRQPLLARGDVVRAGGRRAEAGGIQSPLLRSSETM